MRRYEDVEGCLGDEPNDPSLYRCESDLPDRPTRKQLDREEHEPLTVWPPRFDFGGEL